MVASFFLPPEEAAAAPRLLVIGPTGFLIEYRMCPHDGSAAGQQAAQAAVLVHGGIIVVSEGIAAGVMNTVGSIVGGVRGMISGGTKGGASAGAGVAERAGQRTRQLTLACAATRRWGVCRQKHWPASSLRSPPPSLATSAAVGSAQRNSTSAGSAEASSGTVAADRWLSAVEITTYSPPHRRLWMGPQFTFKVSRNFATPCPSSAALLPGDHTPCHALE